MNTQLSLDLIPRFSRGGRRAGAGRKRIRDRGVAHRVRERLSGREPAHVTLRAVRGLPGFRGEGAFGLIRAAIRAAGARSDFRVVHFAVLENHMHLIVEAENRGAIARGMSGLKVRIAKGLNSLFGRKGALFAQRYHLHILRTPQEVRNGLRYVLLNFAKHELGRGRVVARDFLDPCSSAAAFDGWTIVIEPQGLEHVEAASTWLLRSGWRRHGLISPDEIPSND